MTNASANVLMNILSRVYSREWLFCAWKQSTKPWWSLQRFSLESRTGNPLPEVNGVQETPGMISFQTLRHIPVFIYVNIISDIKCSNNVHPQCNCWVFKMVISKIHDGVVLFKLLDDGEIRPFSSQIQLDYKWWTASDPVYWYSHWIARMVSV